MLSLASDGPAYVPFIGDGDIAAELYTDRPIYGADIDPERVATVSKHLPNATIITADCDKWPFPDYQGKGFAVADFDSYSEPYTSFRAFWTSAPKADRIVLFFTDGHRQGIKRTGHFTAPDGTKRKVDDITDKRGLYNKYWAGVIEPWFREAITGWRIVQTEKYLRKEMLYWGAVIERDRVSISVDNSDNRKTGPQKAYKFDDIKRGAFLTFLEAGHRKMAAAQKVGIHIQTIERHMGLDSAFAEAVSHAELVGARSRNSEIEDALYEAAKSGNVTAIQVWLYNRDSERWADRRKTEITGRDGAPLEIRVVYEDLPPYQIEVTRPELPSSNGHNNGTS